VELKVGNNKPTKLQRKVLDDIYNSTGRSFVLIFKNDKYYIYRGDGLLYEDDCLSKIVSFINKEEVDYGDNYTYFNKSNSSGGFFSFIFRDRDSRKTSRSGEKSGRRSKRREI
jgi:hypothetical protein